MKRYFMKAGAKPINDSIHHVEFDFPGEGDGAPTRTAILHTGLARERPSPWSFKDAVSLVTSGNWVEVMPDEAGGWVAPGPDELAMIAKKRTGDPDAPATTVELVW